MSENADGADEFGGDDDAPGPAASAGPPGAKPGGDWAERLKTRVDAVSALLKALLLLLVLVLIGSAATMIIVRERQGGRIEVEASEQTEAALRKFGLDADVRYALVDAINERIRGAKQVVELTGQSEVTDGSQVAEFSLETFGLHVSSNDLIKAVDEIFGQPADLKIRFDLLCASADCASQRADLSEPARPDPPKLVVSVTSRDQRTGRSLQRTERYCCPPAPPP